MSQAPMAGDRPRECFVAAARKASRRLTQFYDEALERAVSGQLNIQFWRNLSPQPLRRRLPNWRARSFPTVRRSATI
jgi:hypothetical protein